MQDGRSVAKVPFYRSRVALTTMSLCASFSHSSSQWRSWADWVRAGALYTSLRLRTWPSESSSLLTYTDSFHPFNFFSHDPHPAPVCIRDTKSRARSSTNPCQSIKNAQLYNVLRTLPLPPLASIPVQHPFLTSNSSADHPGCH